MNKQVKFVVGKNLHDLEDRLNAHLSEIDAESTITYDFDKCIAVIETRTVCANHICCECSHWDDEGDKSSLAGFCDFKKQFVKFNDCACGRWC